MHRATIFIEPKGPAPVGFRQAMGLPGDIRFDFKTQSNLAYPNIAAEYPQLVLRPFTRPDLHAFDIVIDDPTGASGLATVPATIMNDRFSVEVYTRNSLGNPQRMIAVGKVDLNGYSYAVKGPMGPATFPQGPAGPAGPVGATGAPGPAGAPGLRGSRWYTGVGDPSIGIPDDRVDGDMYLDELNGNVWRWDAAAGTWGRFTGL